jgi:hypothetical protein
MLPELTPTQYWAPEMERKEATNKQKERRTESMSLSDKICNIKS